MTTDDSEIEWYALRVQPQKEYLAAYFLRAKGVHTFVPTEVRHRRRNRYAKGKDAFAFPIIPGCVFAGFAGPPAWFQVLRNPIILGALGFGGVPWRLNLLDLWNWRSRMLDGCLVLHRVGDETARPMRLVHVQGLGMMRSPYEKPRFVSHRRRGLVVEPTRTEQEQIGALVMPVGAVLRSAA